MSNETSKPVTKEQLIGNLQKEAVSHEKEERQWRVLGSFSVGAAVFTFGASIYTGIVNRDLNSALIVGAGSGITSTLGAWLFGISSSEGRSADSCRTIITQHELATAPLEAPQEEGKS